jgi:hypothetical protein
MVPVALYIGLAGTGGGLAPSVHFVSPKSVSVLAAFPCRTRLTCGFCNTKPGGLAGTLQVSHVDAAPQGSLAGHRPFREFLGKKCLLSMTGARKQLFIL